LAAPLDSRIIQHDGFAEIVLTDDKSAIVDVEDVPKISNKKWRIHSKGYVVWGTSRGGKAKFEYLHRTILGVTDEWVDHINGNRLDCRKSNLRIASPTENAHNSKKHRDNTSGYKGVSFDSRRNQFYATIYSHGKKHWLGYFLTAKEAACAYDNAALLHHKHFAKTNFNESNS